MTNDVKDIVTMPNNAFSKAIGTNYRPWADLVIAMLSVNKYRLEQSFLLYQKLDYNGLFDPRNFEKWSHKEVFERLRDSGYNRGDVLIGILSERLLSLRGLVDDFVANEEILASGSKEDIVALLSHVKGVGPVVVDSFLILRGK